MNPAITGLRCTLCGRVDPPDENEKTCKSCGPRGIRDVLYDYAAIRKRLSWERLSADKRQNLARYLPLLPLAEDAVLTPLSVGMTPIVEAPALAKKLGIRRLFVKDDGRQPTGSFKDRASFVGTARAVALGRKTIAAASTGNAATSLAGLAASLGLEAMIFVPRTAPEAKIAQLLIYGAKVFLVDADYDATYDLCQEAVARFGWYDRSAAVNPYLVEGKKTCGHEIAEQMRDELPDWVSIGVGDGCCAAATYKGLLEMKTIGITAAVPKILGVQASGASPLVSAFQAGTEDVKIVEAKTIADSINVGNPRNPIKALRAVRESGGALVAVEDAAIIQAIPDLARASGVFGEPTGVAGIAGIAEAVKRGILGPKDSVLHVVSGNGLKDVRGAMRAVNAPAPIPCKLEAVEARLTSG
ncbi:MAG: threonine synthase [Myxococcota bacterium]